MYRLVFTTDVSNKNVINKLVEKLVMADIDAICRKSDDGTTFEVYVDVNNYKSALIVGSSSDLDNYSVSWVDVYHVQIPIGYIPVMFGFLPQAQKCNKLWLEISDCPENIKNYVIKLRDFCSVSDVKLKYNEYDNSVTVFFKASFMSYDLNVLRCKGFNHVIDYLPFFKVYYPTFDNFVNISYGEINKMRLHSLKSYFDNSLLRAAIAEPYDWNIVPYVRFSSKHHGGFQYKSNLSLKEVKLLSDNKLFISGNFETKDVKGRSYHDCEVCEVKDSGNFVSLLSYTQEGVTMATKICVSRNILGNDKDGKNIRDAYFGCLSDDGSHGIVFRVEHFKKIKDGDNNILLHYSNEFDYFEAFLLSDNWFVDNGLSGEITVEYHPINNGYYRSYSDGDPIFGILKARKKKRNDNKI